MTISRRSLSLSSGQYSPLASHTLDSDIFSPFSSVPRVPTLHSRRHCCCRLKLSPVDRSSRFRIPFYSLIALFFFASSFRFREMATNGGAAKENGAVGGDEKDAEIVELKRKIDGLEEEASARAGQLESLRLEITRLEKGKAVMEGRLESARSEVELSEEDRKALRAVAARAAVLEGDVARLQHDLVASMSESEENSAEVTKLKAAAEELRRSNAEAESRVRVLEEKLAQAESEKAAALSEISANDSDTVSLKRDLKDLTAELSGATVKCAHLQSEVDDWRMQYSMLLDKFEMEKTKDGEEGQSGSLKLPWSGSVMSAASAGFLAFGIAGYFLCAKKR